MSNVHQFPTMRACYVPPPVDIEPIDTLSDPIVGEFSELGREPMGWGGVLAICMAIGVPLILAIELFR